MTDDGPPPDACRREITGLHAFFVEWFVGDREDARRLERALAPGFEMVTPDGAVLGRETVLDRIRAGQGRHEPGAFDIDVRNVEVVDRGPTFALVRYEEWQTTAGEETGRVSTALFRPAADAPEGVAWSALQETWLEA